MSTESDKIATLIVNEGTLHGDTDDNVRDIFSTYESWY